MNADDFLSLPETEARFELVNGVVLMSPSPRPRHWRFVQEILIQIQTFARPLGGFDTYAEVDVRLDDSTVYQPDLAVYARTPAIKPPERLTSPPDLVVEILSPGSKAFDLATKRDTYERFGVKEYWAIDPQDGSEPSGLRVRSWRLDLARYVETAADGDRLASTSLPGFVLDLAPLRAMSGV